MKMTFEQWMKEVDKQVSLLVGLSYQDLPDICYRDLYDDGVSTKSAAKQAIKGAME
jgi:Family of unknown function (DUF5419)